MMESAFIGNSLASKTSKSVCRHLHCRQHCWILNINESPKRYKNNVVCFFCKNRLPNKCGPKINLFLKSQHCCEKCVTLYLYKHHSSSETTNGILGENKNLLLRSIVTTGSRSCKVEHFNSWICLLRHCKLLDFE